MLRVELPEVCLEPLVHRTRAGEDDILVAREVIGHLLDEALEMLEPVRLPGGLRLPAAAVAGQRIVADVAGRPTMRRHSRVEVIDGRTLVRPAHDDGLARVDPDEDRGAAGVGRHGRPGRGPFGHDFAQAGRVSLSAARSA